MDLAQDSIRHLKMLIDIAQELANEGVALCGHKYHALSFGSFSVEFGRSHYRVLCEWDGKESILSLSYSNVTNKAGPRQWIHDANISVPAKDVYAEIASNVLSMVQS